MKRFSQMNGNHGVQKKSKVSQEYERRMAALNRSFASWVDDNSQANLLATWEDGSYDYLAYAKGLNLLLGTSGELFTFGSGDCGQLGHGVDGGDGGDDEYGDLIVTKPRQVKSLANHKIHAVSCGGLHNIVAADDGQVWTWGCADDGCLGRNGDENFPARVEALSKVTICQVSAGDCHSAAISLSGDLYIWGTYKDKDGKNWFRTDGHSDALRQSRDTPMLVPELSGGKHGGVVQLQSGAHHTVVMCGDSKVFSWGIGDSGQLGRPVCELKNKDDIYMKEDVRDQHLTPALMQYDGAGGVVDDARSIACGSYHTFVIKAIRSHVYACGLNQYSQLGVRDSANVLEKLKLVESLEDKHIQSMFAGEHYSVALSCEGTVYTFGRADQHQLGVRLAGEDKKPGASMREPQELKGALQGKVVTNVFCGSCHTIVATQDGEIYSWGFGEMNQLGHGNPANDEEVPRQIAHRGYKRVVGGSCGGQHSTILVEM